MTNDYIINSIFNEEFDNITASELLRKVLNYKLTAIGVTEEDVEVVIGFSNEKDMKLVANQTFKAVEHFGTDFKEIKIIRNSTGAMMIYTSDEG